MHQVVFRKQARLEFDEAGDWYEKERPGLGMEFLSEIQSLIHRIASTGTGRASDIGSIARRTAG